MDNPYTKDLAKMRNKIEGDMGETRAAKFLREKGYRILQTNYKTKFGEIDIIAQDKNVIVFVEVKERATLAFGRPIEAVNFQKQQTILLSQAIPKIINLLLILLKHHLLTQLLT